MLRTLRVSDLAIIDELELFFEPGLNVLTGETGAGKSVLLHALDVALGGRAEADLVRGGAEEGAVEALFTDVPEPTRLALEAAGLPAGPDELLIRRVIPRGGRTRTYVNGALASASPGRRSPTTRPSARRRRSGGSCSSSSWASSSVRRSRQARKRRSRRSGGGCCTPSSSRRSDRKSTR